MPQATTQRPRPAADSDGRPKRNHRRWLPSIALTESALLDQAASQPAPTILSDSAVAGHAASGRHDQSPAVLPPGPESTGPTRATQSLGRACTKPLQLSQRDRRGHELTPTASSSVCSRQVDLPAHRPPCAGSCCWASSRRGRFLAAARLCELPHRGPKSAQPRLVRSPDRNSTSNWAAAHRVPARPDSAGSPRGGRRSRCKTKAHTEREPPAEGDRCHQHGRGVA